MREILFRGKRKDTEEWVYGDLIQRQYSVFIGGYEITAPTWNEPCGDTIYTEDRVFPETVGQFTGLLDKKGNKIFEGDIVLWDGRNAIIEWMPRMAGYYAIWKGEGVHFHECQEINPTHGGLRHVKVISNIHDNPELLNPLQRSSVINNMNTQLDPGTKQEETQEQAAQATEATEQSAELENAEEGATEE